MRYTRLAAPAGILSPYPPSVSLCASPFCRPWWPAFAGLAACGGTGTTAASTPTKLPLLVKAPAGYTVAKSPLARAEPTNGALTSGVADVRELGPTTLADKKTEVKSNRGLTFVKFVLERPNGFIAEMGTSNFILVHLVRVGGRSYQFSVTLLNALPLAEAARQLYEAAGPAKAK